MVKFVLIFVLLTIGYNDIKSVQARVPKDAKIFNDEQVMSTDDQLLPMKLEDYQNDENVDLSEGSGDPFYEENLPPPQIEDTDKTPPDDAQDTVAKEHAVEKSNEQEVMEKENEEEVQISQVVEEVLEDQNANESDDINANDDSSKAEESNDTLKVQSLIEQDNVTKVEVSEEHIDVAKVETSHEQENTSNVVVSEEQVDTAKVETSHEQDNTSSVAISEEQVDTAKVAASHEQDNTSNVAVPEEQVDTSKVEVSNEQVDTIEDNDRNESENNTYEDNHESESADKANIQEESDQKPSGGELEPQETIEGNEMKADRDKDEHASHSMINRKFPFEKDLPAERFGNIRGLGKSMPMQEAKPSDETVVEKVEQKVEESHKDRNDKESPQLPEIVDKNNDIGNDNVEEQKEIDDAGASSASSGSNTVTFVVILGIVCLVGIVGYFVHKRRSRQRATPVPTHEDRELKEVKTHRPNDNDAGRKQACHIPEANPLILNNSHFKRTSLSGTEAIPKNGHLQCAEQQQQLLTTLLVSDVNAKSKDDDIRMMDDDVEDERAERSPLFMSSFKPTVQTISQEQNDEKQLSEDNDRARDGQRDVTSLGDN